MKKSIWKIFRIFKYLVILFTIGYWIYIVIDDYVFIEKYWSTNWLESIGLWALYYLVYLLGFTIYYWVISLIVILIYHKLIKRKTTANKV